MRAHVRLRAFVLAPTPVRPWFFTRHSSSSSGDFTAFGSLARPSIVPTKSAPCRNGYDITSEEDLAEASRKLEALMGTIAGTKSRSDADALRGRLDDLAKLSGKFGGPPGDRTRDTVIKSHVLYH